MWVFLEKDFAKYEHHIIILNSNELVEYNKSLPFSSSVVVDWLILPLAWWEQIRRRKRSQFHEDVKKRYVQLDELKRSELYQTPR